MTTPDLDTYRQRANVRSRRKLVVLSLLMPVMMVLGLVVAGLSMHRPLKMHVLVLVSGISIAIYLLTILGFLGIIRWRTGRWSLEQPAIAGASRRTRRQVFRDVRRGNLPSDEPGRSLAIDSARTVLHQRWVLWVFGIFGVLELINAANQESTMGRVLFALAACFFIAAIVLTLVQRRGARAMLARFDEEQTPELGLGI